MINEIRHINIRPLFLGVIGIINGILFSYNLIEFLYHGKAVIYALLFGLLFCSVCVVTIVAMCMPNSRVLRGINRAMLGMWIYIILGLIAMLTTIFAVTKAMELPSVKGNVTITGRLSTSKSVTSKYVMYELHDISYIDASGIKHDLDYNAKMCIANAYNLDYNVGDYITFKSNLQPVDIFESAMDMRSYNYNTPYFFYLYSAGGVDSRVVGDKTPMEFLREVAKNDLKSVMNEENANIAYSVIFGEKIELSSETKQLFSMSGVSHLLAVSGLHVGVLCLLLCKVLKICHIKPKISSIVCGVVLLLYCMLCGFSPSIVRASVMCVVLLFAKAYGRCYDSLSAISFAFIVVVLFRPLFLFDAGCQLSFLCVLGIVMLSPSFSSLFVKWHMPKVLAESLAISISTNIFIMPVLINTFDKINIVGIFANVLVIPVFTVAYNLLFVCLVIVLICPYLNFILYVPSFFIHIVKLLVAFFAKFDFLNIRVFNTTYFAIALVVFIGIVIKYLMVKRNVKGVLTAVLAMCFAVCALLSVVPNNYKITSAHIEKYNASYIHAINAKDGTLLGCNMDDDALLKYTKNNKILTFKNIFAYDFEMKYIDKLSAVCKEYRIENVYIPSVFQDRSDIITRKINNVKFADDTYISGVNVSIVCYNDNVLGYTINRVFTYCKTSINNSNYVAFDDLINEGSVVVTKMYSVDVDKIIGKGATLYTERSGEFAFNKNISWSF